MKPRPFFPKKKIKFNESAWRDRHRACTDAEGAVERRRREWARSWDGRRISWRHVPQWAPTRDSDIDWPPETNGEWIGNWGPHWRSAQFLTRVRNRASWPAATAPTPWRWPLLRRPWIRTEDWCGWFGNWSWESSLKKMKIIPYQSINQSIEESVNQSINQSIKRSIGKSVNQSINRPMERSIEKSVNQSINR